LKRYTYTGERVKMNYYLTPFIPPLLKRRGGGEVLKGEAPSSFP